MTYPRLLTFILITCAAGSALAQQPTVELNLDVVEKLKSRPVEYPPQPGPHPMAAPQPMPPMAQPAAQPVQPANLPPAIDEQGRKLIWVVGPEGKAVTPTERKRPSKQPGYAKKSKPKKKAQPKKAEAPKQDAPKDAQADKETLSKALTEEVQKPAAAEETPQADPAKPQEPKAEEAKPEESKAAEPPAPPTPPAPVAEPEAAKPEAPALPKAEEKPQPPAPPAPPAAPVAPKVEMPAAEPPAPVMEPEAPKVETPALPKAEEKPQPPAPPAPPALPALPKADAPAAEPAPVELKPADAAPAGDPATAPVAAPVVASGETPTYVVTFKATETSVPLSTKPELDALAKKIKDESGRVNLIAYASGNADQASTARRVSLARALAVRAHLMEQGVDKLSINVQAEGNKNPGGEADRVDVFVVKGERK